MGGSGPTAAHYQSTKGIGLSLTLFVMEYPDLIEKYPELSWSSYTGPPSSSPALIKRSGSSANSILSATPSGNVSRTQIMGFPEVVSPSDRRNDIYVTVVGANLYFSVKNVLVEAKLYLEGNPKPVVSLNSHFNNYFIAMHMRIYRCYS